MTGAPEASTFLIDVTSVPADRRGVGRYVDELVAAFPRPIVVVCQADDAEHYRSIAPSAVVLPQAGIRRAWARLLWEQFLLPVVARRAGAAVIHSPHYTMPLLWNRGRVVTFHDATFFSDPGVHTPVKRVFFRTWIRVSRRLADAIIVPSRATASELARFVPDRRGTDGYRVIHHGVDGAIFHRPTPEAVGEVRSALGLGERPWIAFLGTIEPRKNLPELVGAYAALAAEWSPAWGPVPQLLLAGGDGWGPDLQPEIDAAREPALVRRVGYVDLGLLHAFLGGALFVTYPSLGEGFGLPVLEAMSCGAPVLTTRRLALGEVGGDAVAYSETDRSSLLAAMLSLSSDPTERARLGAAGEARAAGFTWAACASAHILVYEETRSSRG